MTGSAGTPVGKAPGTEVIVSGRADFEAFYSAAYPRLVGQIFVMLGNLDEAQDVAQEAFGRASARWSRVRDEVPEYWVRRLAFSLAARRVRRRARPRFFDRFAQRRSTQGIAPTFAPIGTELAIARMPAHYRALLALHHMAELPVEEIASLLRLPAQSVALQLDHAQKTLNQRLSGRQGVHHA